jgi:hypothetical protein
MSEQKDSLFNRFFWFLLMVTLLVFIFGLVQIMIRAVNDYLDLIFLILRFS